MSGLDGIQGASQEVLERERKEHRERQREAAVARHEQELRRSYLLGTPGATEESWQREKDAILAKDRADRATSGRAQARAAQAAMYRTF